jgi:hypothetical protein
VRMHGRNTQSKIVTTYETITCIHKVFLPPGGFLGRNT